MARPHIEPYVELNDDYQPFTLRDFPAGAHYKALSLDEDTGACSLKMRFDAGYSRPPGMSYSDAELFVLEGRVEVGEHTYGRGQYFFIPAGISMGAMHSADGFEALVFYNDGPPSHVESDQHHELALNEAFVSTNAYLDAPWLGTARRNPGVASYEVFGTLFALTGSSTLFAILGIVLVMSMFVKQPFCRYLCPIDPMFGLIAALRRGVKHTWKRARARARLAG